MCLGESLARNTFFLFTTALLKTFEFRGLPGQPLPTLDPVSGITKSYDEFSAQIMLRK